MTWRAMSARPIARHVIQRISNPLFLGYVAAYDAHSQCVAGPGARRDTPGLHTLVRSLVAAALFIPTVFLPVHTGDSDQSRLRRWGTEFGVIVFLATFCQWRHAGNVAPESFLTAVALGPVLAVASRAMGAASPLAAAATQQQQEQGQAERNKFVPQVTQVAIALGGLLALNFDPDSELIFEPWGTAAAVLFTWGIVRSEVLVAREDAANKARIAAIQTAATASLAAVWAGSELPAISSPDFAQSVWEALAALPLGHLTYLAGVI